MQSSNKEFKVIEKSTLAKVAALWLRKNQMAIVLGKKIFIYGVSKRDFLQNDQWLRHELEHIRQFKQFGFLNFVFRYILESIKNGYQNNKYEILARNAEKNSASN